MVSPLRVTERGIEVQVLKFVNLQLPNAVVGIHLIWVGRQSHSPGVDAKVVYWLRVGLPPAGRSGGIIFLGSIL